MMITPESGRPSCCRITRPWFAIATAPNATTAMPTVRTVNPIQLTRAIWVPRAAQRL